jgi:hypothetical protein
MDATFEIPEGGHPNSPPVAGSKSPTPEAKPALAGAELESNGGTLSETS